MCKIFFFIQMVKYCCVGQCNNRNVKGPTRSDSLFLHKFPSRDKHRATWSQWVSFVNVTRQNFTPSETSCICSAHFKESDYLNAAEYDFYVSQGMSARFVEFAATVILSRKLYIYLVQRPHSSACNYCFICISLTFLERWRDVHYAM